MRTVCFKENLNISSEALTDVITCANNDVRLVLNHLSMLAADKNSTLDAAKKYVKLVTNLQDLQNALLQFKLVKLCTYLSPKLFKILDIGPKFSQILL